MTPKHGQVGKPFREAFFRRNPNAESVIELFQFLPSVFFFAKDSSHRYVGVNQPTLVEVFGLECVDELLGRTDADFQPPALAQAYHAEDRRVMEGGETIPNQVWLVPHVRGTPRWYVSTKTPLKAPSGKVKVCFARLFDGNFRTLDWIDGYCECAGQNGYGMSPTDKPPSDPKRVRGCHVRTGLSSRSGREASVDHGLPDRDAQGQ